MTAAVFRPRFYPSLSTYFVKGCDLERFGSEREAVVRADVSVVVFRYVIERIRSHDLLDNRAGEVAALLQHRSQNLEQLVVTFQIQVGDY